MPGITILRHNAVGGVARREDQRPRPDMHVDDRMDFAVAAAFRDPDCLRFGPPFPPLAQRWALTWELSNASCPGGPDGTATVSNILCQIPALAPAGETIVDRLGGTYSFGQSIHRQPTLRTCMIPLKIRRSSLRRGPGWLVGKCGSIFAHCSSLNQNQCASIG
jgi:hypothetical protein